MIAVIFHYTFPTNFPLTNSRRDLFVFKYFLPTVLLKHSAYLKNLPTQNRCEIMIYSLMHKYQSSRRCVTNTMQNGRKIDGKNQIYYPAKKVNGDEYLSDDLPKFYRA